MSNLEPLYRGKGWTPEAALKDCIEEITDTSEMIILYRTSKNNRAAWRAANLTNAETVFILEEVKNAITNRCHECKCEQLTEW